MARFSRTLPNAILSAAFLGDFNVRFNESQVSKVEAKLSGLLSEKSAAKARIKQAEEEGSEYYEGDLADLDGQIDTCNEFLSGEARGAVEFIEIREESGATHSWDWDYASDFSDFDEYEYATITFCGGVANNDGSGYDISVRFVANPVEVDFTIEAPRAEIPELRALIEDALSRTITKERLEQLAPEQRVFIGHGGNDHWTAVRDYLSAAGYVVEAFEEGDRVGKATLEQVVFMVKSCRAAVLVMNGTDATKDGKNRARQNVIHELGLAQAFLGVEKAIILLESGVEMPSNLAGITHIPYAQGSIYSTKNEVLASLKNKIGEGLPPH